jgi:hypothetical protein
VRALLHAVDSSHFAGNNVVKVIHFIVVVSADFSPTRFACDRMQRLFSFGSLTAAASRVIENGHNRTYWEEVQLVNDAILHEHGTILVAVAALWRWGERRGGELEIMFRVSQSNTLNDAGNRW